MNLKLSDRLVLSSILMIVLGPPVVAQIATCLKNQLGPNACQRVFPGPPPATATCGNGAACVARIYTSNPQCYNVVAATNQDVGKNNTLTPVPQKLCVWDNQACIVPQGGTLSACTVTGSQDSAVYCPEIAGDTCNGGVAPGGGGGNS